MGRAERLGIGRAISEAIAAAGGNVAIIYRSAKDAKDVAATIGKQFNIKCEAWQCDVGDQELVGTTFKEIYDKFGGLHGVVANAGVSVVKDAVEMTKKDYDYVYDANVFGQFACAQAAARLWIEKGFKEGCEI